MQNSVMVKREIVKNVKDNPKMFQKYVQAKVKGKPRILDFYRGTAKHGKTESELKKFETLADQF